MISPALQLIGGYWLEEIRPADLPILEQLPDLAETLTGAGQDSFTDLAVEYQRLFGFNLPPYESVFIDPSAMLNAPASARVQQRYRQAGWKPLTGWRFAAPDHLGLELHALAYARQQPDPSPGLLLLTAHLALWAPVFLLTLKRLDPHPFYARLGDLTLALILETLPADPLPIDADPFPSLPPAPVYRGTYQPPPGQPVPNAAELYTEPSLMGESLQQVLRRLLTPRQAGMFLTRQDLAAAGTALELPGGVGDREHMLMALFRLAAQYELLPELFAYLVSLCQHSLSAYSDLERAYPAWAVYAQAWRNRLEVTIQFLRQLDLQALASSA
ncbi:MAG TPA: molecular chaperone TorD family protein [Anaerolineales bacterium]|nr:molecular chaperone TorD family protein [Anaerolineales bacterium]